MPRILFCLEESAQIGLLSKTILQINEFVGLIDLGALD